MRIKRQLVMGTDDGCEEAAYAKRYRGEEEQPALLRPRRARGVHARLAQGGSTLWSAPGHGVERRRAATLGLDMRCRMGEGQIAGGGSKPTSTGAENCMTLL